MQWKKVAWIAVACLIMAVDAGCDRPEEKVDGDDVEAELRTLCDDYDRLLEAVYAVSSGDEQPPYKSDMTDEEWLKLYYEQTSKPYPDAQMLPRFLAFAKDHKDSPFAFDALAFAIRRGGPATGELHGIPWQIKEQSIGILVKQHMNDPRIVHVFDCLAASIPSEETELLLRRGFENGTDRPMRAAAGLSLARHLHYRSQYHQRSEQLKNRKEIGNSLDRHWNLIVTPYLEENFPYDDERVSSEVDRILAHLVEEYSDIEAQDWRTSGPGNVLLQTVARTEPKTYGDLARSLMLERSKLAPVKNAPEIVGLDSDGKPFGLHEYKGKVVLLTFSANWCGPCKRLYPLQRSLVEEFRNDQFVLLSVSRDESVDTLKSSLTSGEITWRCWWDGIDGSICKAWNNTSTPSVFLLDHEHIIHDVHFHSHASLEDFKNAIKGLLSKIP